MSKSVNNEHEQCTGCGHNYFQGGSGLCKWCIEEQESEVVNNHDNTQHYYNKCREDIKNSLSESERKNLANSFGPNWANIISGLGDQ